LIYQTIKYTQEKNICKITINRPEVRNALNSLVVNELYDAFSKAEKDENIRLVILSGEGKSFCAGADLKWLGEVADFSYEQNYDESYKLVKLLYLIHDLSKPVIARVNGSAVGGGVGLMLVSDIIIADDESLFGISEVSIGIVPAAIVPFILNRIGETKAREYLITGERINAKTAQEIGLINYAVKRELLDKKVNTTVDLILGNGPNALRIVKSMINIIKKSGNEEHLDYIAQTIAELRISLEGQEGMRAFLSKTKPSWAIK